MRGVARRVAPHYSTHTREMSISGTDSLRKCQLSGQANKKKKLEREVMDLRQELYDLRITLHTFVDELKAEIDYKMRNNENK